jgi:cellulose synthase/poly-beta-1,6-N-acetylglucosamine synthase-like glycosyltransferase
MPSSIPSGTLLGEPTVAVADPAEAQALSRLSRKNNGREKNGRHGRPSGRPLQNIALVAVMIAGISSLVLAHCGVWAIAAATLLSPALLGRPNRTGRQLLVLAFTVGMFVAATDYVAWRVGVTNWAAWLLAAPLLVAEVFGIVHAVGLMQTVWPRSLTTSHHDANTSDQPIFILVPTVNEGVEVLAGTLAAARVARDEYLVEHPSANVRIVVCNDGRVARYENWMQVDEFVSAEGLESVTRTIGGGAKAGNLENARQLLGIIGDAILIIFDADQQAYPDFLLRTVHELDDSRVAWVQTGQFYSNIESPVARWAEHQQAIFYSVLLPGKSTLNSAFICGTNVVIRAAALDEIGGFPQDSVTEDFAASLELHNRWRSVFVAGKLAEGLGPMDLPAYLKQQDRWAVGTLGTLRTHFGMLISPRRTGMTVQQRVQYLLAQTHYLTGLKDLIFVLAPIIFLLTGTPAVVGADIAGLLSHFVPYFVLSQTAFWLIVGKRSSLRGILIGFASFPVLLISLVTVIMGRKVAFRITSKQRTNRIGLWHLAPHALGFVTCVLALLVVSTRGSVTPAEIVTIFWVSYTGMMFAGVLYLGARDIASSRALNPARRARRKMTLSRSARYALGGVVVILVVSAAVPLPAHAASPYVVPSTRAGNLRLGASLPGYATASDVSTAFPNGLDVVGRTQSIDERFDTAWAAQLTRAGTTPWLTLILGNGKKALDSNLLGMSNGLDDPMITRWAAAMRDFGRPMYLTMLPAVDVRWSTTTAVSQGGIPEDVPRAWARLRHVLDAVGADNVALAWAPALPASDQQFAPPESQIDVVIITLYSYPGSTWADPAETLAAVERRHRNKPIIIEVAAAGTPKRKATWLRSVAKAAVDDHAVRALLYHDSDPGWQGPTTSAAHAKAWLISSDEWSQSVFAQLETSGSVSNMPFAAPLVSAPVIRPAQSGDPG